MRLDILVAGFVKSYRQAAGRSLLVLLLCHPGVPSWADQAPSQQQIVEDFDGVQPTWHLDAKSPSLAEIRSHRRSDHAPFRGRRCEYISVVGNRGGEQILAHHWIPGVAAIQELKIGLWMRGDRSGFQLMARVRLPRELDAHGEPLSLHVYGDSYTAVGLWQQLVLTDLEDRVADVVRTMRIERGRHIDLAEAYVDQVAINAYGGSHMNRLWIDDLSLEAAVPIVEKKKSSITEPVQLANYEAPVQGNGAQREWPNLSNWVPRGVSYHGESFELLKQLGFNTIWLDQMATKAQLDTADRLNLRLMCPFSADFAASIGDHDSDCVIGWTIDGHLQSPQAARNKIRSIRTSDPLRRPIIVFANQDSASWSNVADIIIVGNGKQLDLQTQSSQWAALGAPLISSSRWLPLRKEVRDGVIAGYRGFVLMTERSLDDPSLSHTRNLAELLNMELRMLGPWIVSPQLERLENRDDKSKFDFVALSDLHSTIAVVRPRLPNNRFALRQDVVIPTADHRLVFRIEPGGLSPPVSERRVPGGIRISLDPSKPDGLLLLTDRKAIVETMTRFLRSIDKRNNQLLVQILREELLQLDRRIERDVSDPARRTHLRQEVHALHGRIAPLLESDLESTASFRQLDHVLSQLERVHETIDH